MENVLFWTPEQQVASDRNMNKIFPTRRIPASENIHPLPYARANLDDVMIQTDDAKFIVDEYFTRLLDSSSFTMLLIFDAYALPVMARTWVVSQSATASYTTPSPLDVSADTLSQNEHLVRYRGEEGAADWQSLTAALLSWLIGREQVIRNLINGKWVASEEIFENLNPATGEVLCEVAAASAEQVNEAVQAAKDAFPAWAGMPVKQRSKLIVKLGDAIASQVDEISEMESRDTGLTISLTRKQLIPRAADNFYYFAEMAKCMNGETYPVDDQMLNYTLYQPVGVCGLISPWNVPFMTATWKVAPALALGNTAVLKMSELSPMTAHRLGEIALDVGIPPGVLNIVQGWGHTAGDALVSNPDVRVISFTGGTRTGETITRRAGLKKLSLELGGKSPVLIFDDADLSRALDSSLFTIFSINGERCTAGSRILVQETIYDQFVSDFAARAKNIKVGDPLDPDTAVGALISKDHFKKVSGYVDIARNEGATVLAGGSRPEGLADCLKDGNFLSPTVISDVDNSMRCAQEEIFGPVACLIPFKDEADALRIANDNMYGLTAYLWTNDNGRVHRLSRELQAGMVFVNSQNVRDLRQPFGGIKMSGVGREGGHFSFETFAEVKNVCVSLGSHHIPRWGA